MVYWKSISCERCCFMQATYNDSASTMLFATGRDYMMRSEKRGRSGGSPASGAPKKRPHRRRRKRAGFFYKLIMMILLLVLWPVGLIMLWQRKVRWGVGTKLLTSVVTSGTGSRARLSNMTVAGKTGTTNNNYDQWFVGYTPYYTASGPFSLFLPRSSGFSFTLQTKYLLLFG